SKAPSEARGPYDNFSRWGYAVAARAFFTIGEIPRSARDFGRRLPLSRFAGSLTPPGASIHPSALAFAIFFVLFIRRAEVAVFVEVVGRILVVLAHVDLKFLSGAASFPAMVTVSKRVNPGGEEGKNVGTPPHHAVPEKSTA